MTDNKFLCLASINTIIIMIIGLVRHFKVNIAPAKFWLSPGEFEKDLDDYDVAPIYDQELNISHIDWEVCYCSTLPRAVSTAQKIYNWKIIQSDLLREIPIKAVTKKNIKLPAFIWHTLARIHWLKNKSTQPEGNIKSHQRANKVLNEILQKGSKNILLVSHGFFMRALYNELLKIGFKGEMEINPKNGKLYIMKKQTN